MQLRTCPLTSTWWRGAIYGGVIGLLWALNDPEELEGVMKRKKLYTIACLALAAASGSSLSAEVWTLQSAIETALENSPDAQVAKSRVAGAEAMLDEARSYGKPQLSLKGSYMQTDSPMMAFGSILNQRAFNFGLDFNNPGTIDNLNGTATLGMNLYAGGKVAAGQRAAAAGLSAASFDDTAARQQLVAQTVKAYLDIRRAKEAVLAVEAGSQGLRCCRIQCTLTVRRRASV